MKICRKTEIIERKNAANCIVSEYPMDETTLDFAIVNVQGRYPEQGFAVNRKVKEIVYVAQGSGKVCVNHRLIELNQEDVILIEAGEFFYWDGVFTLWISCNPAFTVEQHEISAHAL